MRLTLDERYRLRAEVMREVPLPAPLVWGQMRDWRRFLTLDPVHRKVETVGRGRNNIRITHRLLGIRVERAGRLLRWRENETFVVSDLSLRGVRVGFPHVCIYGVEPIDSESSRIIIGVRGKWTATWIPRLLIRAWVWWILESTGAHVQRDLFRFSRWRRRNGRGTVRP